MDTLTADHVTVRIPGHHSDAAPRVGERTRWQIGTEQTDWRVAAVEWHAEPPSDFAATDGYWLVTFERI